MLDFVSVDGNWKFFCWILDVQILMAIHGLDCFEFCCLVRGIDARFVCVDGN